MKQGQKILIISDTSYNPVKIYLDQMPKLAKGFIRLGHDVRHFNYGGALAAMSPLRSRRFAKFFYKSKVDSVLAETAKHYRAGIVYVSFAKYLDRHTINMIRNELPDAIFIGGDGDPWPGKEEGRIETASELDILLATNNGSFLDEYKQAGIKKCVFMPNMCDPDIDHRYEVDEKWRVNLLWTGTVQHKAGTANGDCTREEVIRKLADRADVRIYGCLGKPKIRGIDYLYAISGARIGISINAVNCVSLYHSDRLTHYTACGTMVLAKRVPDTECLMADKIHVRYFDTPEECVELAEWYLAHESERKKIADSGMEHCHRRFNSVKIAGYIMDLIDTGQYRAPWGVFS